MHANCAHDIDKKFNLIEHFIDKLKRFSRVFFLFEKWTKNHMFLMRCTTTFIWLR